MITRWVVFALASAIVSVLVPSFGATPAFAKGNPQVNQCLAALATCNASLESCETDLATCQATECGNGVAEFGEACDGKSLQLPPPPGVPFPEQHTCQIAGYAYGKLSCSNDCSYDVSGCTNDRFVDTGLTIIDNQTGLEWEKKTNDNNPVHDVDNTYAWTSTGTAPDGPLFKDFLAKLNSVADCTSSDGSSVSCGGSCFAGHCDWRVPEIGELRGILTAQFPNCTSSPCIDPIFGATAPARYWSRSTHADSPSHAWVVLFDNAGLLIDLKDFTLVHARGVRGGSP